MKLLPCIIVVALGCLPLSGFGAADVVDRYIAVLGIRETHDELVLRRFAPVLADLETHDLLPRDPDLRRAKLEELRRIILDAVGFENVRIEYRIRVERMFSKSDLEATIGDLENPSVSALLKKQGVALGEEVTASEFSGSRGKMERVLRLMRASLSGRGL